jgi:hypothetical protein
MVGGQVSFYLKITEEEAQLIPTASDLGRTFVEGEKGANLARLRRALGIPEKRRQSETENLAKLQRDLEEVKAIGGDFEHREQLDALRKRAAGIDALLRELERKQGQQVMSDAA